MSVKFTFAARVKPVSSAHSTATATASSKPSTATHRSVNNGSGTEQSDLNISPPKIYSVVFNAASLLRILFTYFSSDNYCL